MNKLLTCILVLGSLSVFSSDKIDFTCMDDQGFKYEYSNEYGQLSKYSKSGELVDLQDTLVMNTSFYETFPMTYGFAIGYYDEDDTFMSITFLGESKKGKGTIFDVAVSCTR